MMLKLTSEALGKVLVDTHGCIMYQVPTKTLTRLAFVTEEHLDVQETIEEIEQQIKEGGIVSQPIRFDEVVFKQEVSQEVAKKIAQTIRREGNNYGTY